MGLETGTYISDLTPAWPTASETKSQGDDHLRLIKEVVKNTFPNGSRAFYFPITESISGTLSLDATDWNNIVEVDTTGGNVTVNLPSTLGATDKGWSCEVIKISNDANAAIVTPAAGTILAKVGSVATVRVGILCEPAKFIWNGTGWRCSKPGPMIGSTEEFNGPLLPPGYLWEQGSGFSSTLYAELYKALGNVAVTPDKRGRVSFGKDNMNGDDAGRLTAALTGGIDGDTLLAAGGLLGISIGQANLPSLNLTVTGTVNISDPGHTHTVIGKTNPTPGTGAHGLAVGAADASITNAASSAFTGITASLSAASAATGGSNTSLTNLPPGIVVNKIIRAC